jgi:hypothetical protein
MGEERTDTILEHHDKDINEIKVEIKDINVSVTEIEKTNIEIQINVKSILDTYKTIKNTTIGFVVLNILTMLWTLSKNLGG